MFCLSRSQSINQSICPTVRHVCLFVRGSDRPSVPPSIHPSIHPASHPYSLSVYLSVYFLFDRPLVKAHYFFTDSLIGPGHLHRKKHTEPSFCVLSVFVHPSRRQSINQSVRPSAMSVCSYVGLTVRPSIHPSIHPFIQPSIHL